MKGGIAIVNIKGSNNDFKKAKKFLRKAKQKSKIECAEEYAEKGLQALRDATPKRSGATAAAWSYEIRRTGERVIIQYKNSNVNKGCNIAILIQYGHGTGTGGYVSGIDFINPALKPVFSSLAKQAWKEMISLE